MLVLFVKLLSVVMIIGSCFIILRPDVLKEVIAYVKNGNRFYIAKSVKIVIGILLLVAAHQCAISWIVLLLGALTAIGGILAFVLKKEIVMGMLEKGEKLSAKHTAFLGVVLLALGILLTIAA